MFIAPTGTLPTSTSNSSEQNSSEQHGDARSSSGGLNPSAQGFTPGGGAAPLPVAEPNAAAGSEGKQPPQQPARAAAAARRPTAGALARELSRPEGSTGGSGGRPKQQQQQASPFGRSPGRGSTNSGGGSISANHLLNFRPSGRAEAAAGAGRRGGAGGGGRGRGGGRSGPARRAARPQAFDRTKFLQANFLFLVSDAADVRRFEADADLMLDWEDVVQVEVLSSVPLRCPISLDTPFCPQITPCGHIFAFPAIVGHLVNHGGPELRKSAPCPLCYTQIAARELRLVRIRPIQPPTVGATCTFQLLRRPRDTILPATVGPDTASAAVAGAEADVQSGTTTTTANSVDGSRGQGLGAGGREGGSGGLVLGGAEGSACNKWAKFTTVADPMPLFVAEAERLAAYATEVTAEGGLEAAYEAPNIYSAMDALAARARAWAERRQRCLLEAADPLAAERLPSLEEAGVRASAAVRAATTAAVSAAAVARERSAAQAALEAEFPSLAPAPPARPMTGARAGPAGGGGWRQAGTTQRQQHQPAFSDEEEQEQDGSQGLPAAQHAQRAQQPLAIPPGRGGSSRGRGGAQAQGGSPTKGGAGPSAGGAEQLLSSSAQSGGLLGSSPDPASAAATAAASGDYYFYQAADGQWMFLCALNLRMLLQHFGSFQACPPLLSAKVLEVEKVVQDEGSRRRMRVLSHLPLTSSFKLAELDLAGVLPPEALAPYAEELAQREKKRAQRAKQEARQALREAAAAAALAAASAGPSAAELRAMPLLGPSRPAGAGAEAGAFGEQDGGAAAAGEEGEEESAMEPPSPPERGVSFARIAALGFAATGPTLGEAAGGPASPAAADAFFPALGGGTGSAAAPRGSWGARPAVAAAAPAVLVPTQQQQQSPAGAWGVTAAADRLAALSTAERTSAAVGSQEGGGSAKGSKGKKGKQLLLLSGPQRKY